MSAPETSKSQADREQLDLLVDGELGEAERDELLRRLEGQPGGWRRCALAFLEAQCWCWEFTAFAGKAVVPAETPPSEPRAVAAPARPARKLLRRAATPLAMAASFFLAFWLGRVVHDVGGTGSAPAPTGERLAHSVPASPPDDPSPSNGNGQPATPSPQQRPATLRSPWQMVTLAANGPQGQRPQTFHLPACEQQRLNRHWLGSLPSALPCDVLESLERAGYRVRQHHELVPIDMHDGRRLVVPVEEIEVEYVGRPSL